MNTSLKDAYQSINILAFDASGEEASLALWTEGVMRGVSLPVGTGPHSQAAQLLPAMQDLLKSAGRRFQDMDVIAVPTGPGSFTGIRIGIAAAQGLLLSIPARSFAPTAFQVVAFGAWRKREDFYLVALTTKRESYYTQNFDKSLCPRFRATIQTAEEIEDFLALHPEVSLIKDPPSAENAQNLIWFYLHELKTSQDLSLASPAALTDVLRPYYLHNPEFARQKPWSL